MSKAENGEHLEDVAGLPIDAADRSLPEGDGGKASPPTPAMCG
jgi:hypothetical protein